MLAGDVAGEGGFVAPGNDLEEADGLEPAIAPDDIPEVAEDLEALERKPGLGLVGVVHAHQRPGFPRGARTELPTLEEEDVLNSAGCQMKSGAGAVGSTADHDHVRPRHESSAPFFPR